MTEFDFSKLNSIRKCKVVVKPSKAKTKIIEFDSFNNVLTVEVGAIASENKANIELIKFLTRNTKKKITIKSGFTSKEKIIEFD